MAASVYGDKTVHSSDSEDVEVLNLDSVALDDEDSW